MKRVGKASLRALMARMTGPFGSDALEPVSSLTEGARGTPKRMTELRPLATSGVRNGISLLTPRLRLDLSAGVG